jgi:hypothetical protein
MSVHDAPRVTRSFWMSASLRSRLRILSRRLPWAVSRFSVVCFLLNSRRCPSASASCFRRSGICSRTFSWPSAMVASLRESLYWRYSWTMAFTQRVIFSGSFPR